jgi:predicted dehydrogenase
VTIKIGIVGAGHMGRLHADKLALLCEVERGLRFVGVADLDIDRAKALAAVHGCRYEDSARALLSDCDALVVAVPTIAHFEVVSQVLEAGLDVLVEKPVAATLPEAEALLALARDGDRVLRVGHQEWFNAAMKVLRERTREPRFVEVHRMGPFPDRATDVDVVRDLMIHDLEILQRTLGEVPDRIDAIGIPVLTANVDIANARLHFPSGCIANLTASRVSTTPIRKLRLFQPSEYFSIDFLESSAVVFRRTLGAGDETPQIQMEELAVDPGDALRDQLVAFLHAVRTRELPEANGVGSLDALRTALRIIEAMPPADEYA